MLERTVEHHLVEATKQLGGICLKFVSPSMDGMPDRLVLLPGGRCGFVEVKAPGQHPRSLQIARHRQLRHLGYVVEVLDDPNQIPQILNTINGGETREVPAT